MADEKLQISLGDMLRSITQEFAVALTLVKRSHPSVLVRSVKLKLGQSPEDAPELDEPPPPLILPDRYPEVDKGWQIELELGEKASASLQGKPILMPRLDAPTALDTFAEHSISAIQGIDVKWSQFFTDFDIIKIRHLAGLEEPLLQTMTAQSRSLLPREFRQKALLLKMPLPALPDSAINKSSIYNLLLLPVKELHEKLGMRLISLTEVRDLLELLDLLNLVIDSAVLRQTKLSELLEC